MNLFGVFFWNIFEDFVSLQGNLKVLIVNNLIISTGSTHKIPEIDPKEKKLLNKRESENLENYNLQKYFDFKNTNS